MPARCLTRHLSTPTRHMSDTGTVYVWWTYDTCLVYVWYMSDRCLVGVDRCLVRHLTGIWHLSGDYLTGSTSQIATVWQKQWSLRKYLRYWFSVPPYNKYIFYLTTYVGWCWVGDYVGWGTSSVVERSLIMREVPGSIPGPVKMSPARSWQLESCESDSWETTCNKYVAVGHRSFGWDLSK